MKTYTIRHEETLVGYYEIEAESPEEAFKQYEKLCDEGLFDFTDLDIISGKDTVHETEKNGCLGKAIEIVGIDLSEEALNTERS